MGVPVGPKGQLDTPHRDQHSRNDECTSEHCVRSRGLRASRLPWQPAHGGADAQRPLRVVHRTTSFVVPPQRRRPASAPHGAALRSHAVRVTLSYIVLRTCTTSVLACASLRSSTLTRRTCSAGAPVGVLLLSRPRLLSLDQPSRVNDVGTSGPCRRASSRGGPAGRSSVLRAKRGSTEERTKRASAGGGTTTGPARCTEEAHRGPSPGGGTTTGPARRAVQQYRRSLYRCADSQAAPRVPTVRWWVGTSGPQPTQSSRYLLRRCTTERRTTYACSRSVGSFGTQRASPPTNPSRNGTLNRRPPQQGSSSPGPLLRRPSL